MTKGLAFSFGTLGVGGVGIGAAGVYYFKSTPKTSKVTFGDRYSKALIDSDSGWTAKLNVLSKVDLVPKNLNLVKAKIEKNDNKPEDAKASLKRGCGEIYSKEVGNEDDFSDFKNFCSLNNGDKIGVNRQLVGVEGDFDSHWSTFSSSSRDSLYVGFREIFDSKGASADVNNWKSGMLAKCKEIASDIFEDPISNFNTFCTKDKSSGSTITQGPQG